MGWVSFTEPASMDCRGIMFDITDGDSSAILVSLPPRKFFEYEHDTRDHTMGRIGDKMVKLDGSLISTYIHKNKKTICLKSKASLDSPQVRIAESTLSKNTALCKEIQSLVEQGYTVNFELTSPRNQIVIPYEVDRLTILSIRSHITGENLFGTRLQQFLLDRYPVMMENMVSYESFSTIEMPVQKHRELIEAIRTESVGEGYVVEIILNDGTSYLTKVKNNTFLEFEKKKKNPSLR
jgi:T4 RnlA family RNA ligase